LAVSENELRLSSARENQIVVTIAFPTGKKIRFREKNILGLGASLALKYNSNWAREYDSKVTFVKATQ